MAGNTVNVDLTVSDSSGSLKQRNQEAKELNQNLSAAARSAEKALRPAARMQPRGEGTEYGRARGSMGTTGAGARDFANQAQGLGGLVRVYATVAANLFAVSAAFNALKEAANTTNMIKGLDQLGAASGVALGSLSQRLVAATDNAISLREAMTTVAKASAAGLTSKQIIEIGQYAKTASQALGLDMTDAISRLTRGITKLEPELLDELGLFTKIGPATEQYALKLGKSAATLTDFERRQAFANAVLAEARDKFGKLQLDANPYQKLEASIRNLATAGLELINKFLTPLVDLLSNNTGLLTVALGLVASKLTTMAIPALVSWRSELVKSATLAKEKAKEINEAFGAKFTQQSAIKLNIPELEKNLGEAKNRVKQATQDLLKYQKDNNLRTTKTIAATAAGTFGQDPKDMERAQSQIRGLQKQATVDSIAYAEKLKALKDATSNLTKEQNLLTKAYEQQENQAKRASFGEMIRNRISANAGARAERLNILSQVGANTETGGFIYAMSKLNEEVRKSTEMGGINKFRTRFVGTMAAAATSVGMVLSALGNVGAAIGIVVGIAAVMRAQFSKNAKEMDIFNTAVKASNDTVKTSIRTLNNYGDAITTASLAARANVFRELASNIDEVTSAFTAAEKKAGWVDTLFEGILEITPGVKSAFQDLTSTISGNLTQQLAQIPEGPAREAIKEKLTSILSTEDLTEAGIEKALKKSGRKGAVKLAENAATVFLEQRNAVVKAGEDAQKFAESMKGANTEAEKLIQSLAVTDPMVKFGESLIKLGIDFKLAAQDAKTSIAAIKEAIKDPKSLALVSPEAVVQLKQMAQQLPEVEKVLVRGEQKLMDAKLEVDRLQALQDKINVRARGVDTTQYTQQLNAAKEVERQAREDMASVRNKMQDMQNAIIKIGNDSIRAGYKLIQGAADRAFRQGIIDLQKNLLQGLSGPEIVTAQASLERESIKLRREELNETAKLIETMIKNNTLAEARLAFDQATQLQKEADARGGSTESEGKFINQLLKRAEELGAVGGLGKLGLRSDGSAMTTANIEPQTEAALLQLQSARRGTAAKNVQLDMQSRAVDQNEFIQKQEQIRIRDNQRIADLNKQKDLELQLTEIKLGARDILSDTEIKQRQLLQTEQQERNQTAATKVIRDEISGITDRIAQIEKDGITSATLDTWYALLKNKAAKEDIIKALQAQQKLEQEILKEQQRQAEVANYYSRVRKNMEMQYAIQEAQSAKDQQVLKNQQDILGVRAQLFAYTEDELRTQQLKLEGIAAVKEAEKANFDAKKQYDLQILAIAQKLSAANFTEDAIADYQKEAQALYEVLQLNLQTIDQAKQGRLEVLQIQSQLTSRVQAYDQVFRNAFSGMADAIVDFAKTGKLSFKSMIDSMIEGLIRYELQQQALLAYSAAGGAKGIIGFLTSMVGAGAGPNANITKVTGPSGNAAGIVYTGATGGAFEYGVEKFAKGGMFTNSVVTNPTLFKFARGTGLMGEAGPEAIMPLRRDSEGNLGVMAKPQGNKVEVIVNNFSGEKAEARETVDSRGDRKIEIIVGEMVAGEVGRKNSPMQQAISGNFMTKPSVTRR
jgi:lambda family phage tail tape measure protein